MPPDTRLTATLPETAVKIFVSLSYASSYSLFLLCLSKARRLMVQWMLLLRQRVRENNAKFIGKSIACTHTDWKKQKINSDICRAFSQLWFQLHVIFRCSWDRIKVLVCGVRREGGGGLKLEALYLTWIHCTQNQVWCKVCHLFDWESSISAWFPIVADLFKHDKPCFQHKGYRLKFQVIIFKHSLIPQVKNPPDIALGKNGIWRLLSLLFFSFLNGCSLFSATPLSNPLFPLCGFLLMLLFQLYFLKGLPLFPNTSFASVWAVFQKGMQPVQSILAWVRNPYGWAEQQSRNQVNSSSHENLAISLAWHFWSVSLPTLLLPCTATPMPEGEACLKSSCGQGRLYWPVKVCFTFP